MAKCPKCQKQVTYLECEQKEVVDLKFVVDKETEDENYELLREYFGNAEVTSQKFSCPECKADLFQNEGDAKDFLLS